MTIQMDASDVVTAIEVASWVASLLAMRVIGLLVWLMVRPSRRRRDRDQGSAIGAVEAEEMMRLMARVEQRLEVLERLVVQDARAEEHVLEAGEARETRRAK